nr:unnamed protein product [Digitaria exilis]
MAHRRRGAPPQPCGDPRPGERRRRCGRELSGPTSSIKPSAAVPLDAGGGECTGPRKAGALGGESYELSANEGARGGGVAVEADVFPASPPMASTDRQA